jgi:hypothetical protein
MRGSIVLIALLCACSSNALPSAVVLPDTSCRTDEDCGKNEWCKGVSHRCPTNELIYTSGVGSCHRLCYPNGCTCTTNLDCGPEGLCDQGTCRGSGAGKCALPPPCNMPGCAVMNQPDLICSACVCAMCP